MNPLYLCPLPLDLPLLVRPLLMVSLPVGYLLPFAGTVWEYGPIYVAPAAAAATNRLIIIKNTESCSAWTFYQVVQIIIMVQILVDCLLDL